MPLSTHSLSIHGLLLTDPARLRNGPNSQKIYSLENDSVDSSRCCLTSPGTFPYCHSNQVPEMSKKCALQLHLVIAVIVRRISLVRMPSVRSFSLVRRVSIVFAVSVITLIAIYFYAVSPHHSTAPADSASGLLDRADTLSWGNRWSDAQPLYRRAEPLFVAQRQSSRANYS